MIWYLPNLPVLDNRYESKVETRYRMSAVSTGGGFDAAPDTRPPVFFHNFVNNNPINDEVKILSRESTIHPSN